MANTRGGTVTLTASYALVDSSDTEMTELLTIRNANNNGTVTFSFDGSKDAGFLNGSEAKTFKNVGPARLYVRGTSDETLYWDAQ